MQYEVSLQFGPPPTQVAVADDSFAPTGFIAHPYWPEREQVISLRKRAGVDRPMLSESRRAQVLSQHLQSVNMTMVSYLELERRANRAFYTWADVLDELDDRDPQEIVISAHQMYGCLAQAASLALSAVRIATPERIRSVLHVSDFETGKVGADGTWQRYVTVKGGSGAKLSNQRGLRSNEYIENFVARGSISFSANIITDPTKVRQFLEYAGRDIGVGASRKMGWGRFVVKDWRESK